MYIDLRFCGALGPVPRGNLINFYGNRRRFTTMFSWKAGIGPLAPRSNDVARLSPYNMNFDVVVRSSADDFQQNRVRFRGNKTEGDGVFLHFRPMIFRERVGDYAGVGAEFIRNRLCKNQVFSIVMSGFRIIVPSEQVGPVKDVKSQSQV